MVTLGAGTSKAKKTPPQRSELILTTRIGQGRALVSALLLVQAMPSEMLCALRISGSQNIASIFSAFSLFFSLPKVVAIG